MIDDKYKVKEIVTARIIKIDGTVEDLGTIYENERETSNCLSITAKKSSWIESWVTTLSRKIWGLVQAQGR